MMTNPLIKDEGPMTQGVSARKRKRSDAKARHPELFRNAPSTGARPRRNERDTPTGGSTGKRSWEGPPQSVPRNSLGKKKEQKENEVTDSMSSSYETSKSHEEEGELEQGHVRVTTKQTEALLVAMQKRLDAIDKKEAAAAKRAERRRRSQSPTRRTPPPTTRDVSRSTRAPIGYARSTCKLNHACNNPSCYTSTKNPNILWDRSKYARPYVPRW